MMGSEVLKVEFFNVFDYSHAPGGPIKDDQIEDSSELMMQKSFMLQLNKTRLLKPMLHIGRSLKNKA